MPIFYPRNWISNKGTHVSNFRAGQDLLERTLVKETAQASATVIEALTFPEAIGFVISSKGALLGERVDVLLFEDFHEDAAGPVTPSGVHIGIGCPTVNDDSTLGYIVGTEWFSTTRKAMWISVSDVPGAAVWTEISNFHFDTIPPTVNDDYDNCFFPGFKWWDDTAQRFWLCVDATIGAAVWIDIGPGISDVLIGNTLHVDDVYGNDATAVPNSLVNKYLTITAALAASTIQDTIFIWPGTYVIPATLDIDGTVASRFHAYIGAIVTTPPLGNPAFNISPGVNFKYEGHGSWLVRSDIFVNSNPTEGICHVDFEADLCGQFGTQGFVANLTSIRGTAKIYRASDLAFFCDGWCDVEVQIDKSEFTGSAFYNISNVSNNNGTAFNASEGIARFQLRGRTGKYAYVEGSYGPGFLDAIFSFNGNGNRDARHSKICADIYAFDSPGFTVMEGSVVWEGSGFCDKDALPVNDLYPFFNFDTDNQEFYFEHRMGSVNSNLDNTICLLANNGVVKLCGNYYAPRTDFPLIRYEQGTIGSRLILSGNYQTNGPIHVIEMNEAGLGTAQLLIFELCTIYAAGGGFCLDTISGGPFQIYVSHSLITNTNYNVASFTDISVGNRHYVDASFTNYIPSEHLQ